MISLPDLVRRPPRRMRLETLQIYDSRRNAPKQGVRAVAPFGAVRR
jgi:hypothetical protein